MKTKVLSVGGSIVAPDRPDPTFIKHFIEMLRSYLEDNPEDRLILVVGGGGPARTYQRAFYEVVGAREGTEEAADWLGIKATHLNAELIKACLGDLCEAPVVTDPMSISTFSGRALVAAGWKPGFSTDNDAVLLAKNHGADAVINLSNIAQVYTADPKEDPTAQPLDEISWADFRQMVGDTWEPGKNLPFDPIASRHAEEQHLTVICAAGRDLQNTRAILDGLAFTGTTIK